MQQNLTYGVSSPLTTPSYFTAVLPYVYNVYNFASFYVEVPAVLTGLFLNVHVLIVFLFTPYSTSSSTRFYYTVIASCDIGTLIAKHMLLYLFGNGVFAVGAPRATFWTIQGNLEGCRTVYAIWLLAEITGNCTLVALGVERAIAVYWPFTVRNLSRRKSMIGISCLFSFAMLVAIGGALNDLVLVNPYTAIGIGCYAGGGVPLALAIAAPTALFCDYFIPSILSITLAILIVVKLRKVQAQKAAISRDKEQSQGLSSSEIESCITLILQSSLHVAFFLPLTIFRFMATVLPYFMTLEPSTRLFLTGMGLVLYVVVSPFYSVNFFVYCRRVKGFVPNLKRIWKCQKLVEEK